MDKKIIWGIILLMTASVVGIMTLQITLINHYYNLEEQNFSAAVFSAMDNVVNRLEVNEKVEKFNGYSAQTPDFLAIEQSFHGIDASPDDFPLDSTLVKQHNQSVRRFFYIDYPLEDRINCERLDTFLRQSFRSHHLQLKKFQYGVYSRSYKSFIILNGVSMLAGHAVAPSEQLINSQYRADVFPGDPLPPGSLYVYIPSKAAIVWKELWLPLLLGLAFSMIIITCFAYTINIIFKQKKVSEMKNDFINNMTHEFKTPIATISLASDSISSPSIINNPEKIKRFADVIKQENRRMNSQVEKVLQMALIDRDEYKLHLASVDVNEVVRQAVMNASLVVEKRSGSIAAYPNATNPVVEGDLTHISNVVNNLLDNANKYSPEHPEITVTTRNVVNGVEITVADKGIGMSKEARKFIFDKFYRVPTGNLHDVKGFGLGLTYVRAMMIAHKGQIDVKSELGKGSAFTLFFPFRVGLENAETGRNQ